MGAARFIVAFGLAGFVTFGLFYLMQSLIGVEGELARSSTDSNVPISMGVPAVTIGRGGVGANGHAPDEHIRLADFEVAPGPEADDAETGFCLGFQIRLSDQRGPAGVHFRDQQIVDLKF